MSEPGHRPAPNLFVIGAQRAGSTSMWRYLRAHPQIFMADAKEPGFLCFAGGTPVFSHSGDASFYDQIVTDEDAYFDLFVEGEGFAYRGESSSFYLYFDTAQAELQRRFPDAKLLVILRDPVERVWSSYSYLRRLGAEPLDDLADALDAEPVRIADNWEPLFHYVAESRYSGQLARLYEKFDRSQVHVAVLEQLEADGPVELARIFDWLGVDVDVDVDADITHNSSRRSRFAAVERLLSPGLLPRGITDRIPRAVKDRAVGLRERNRTVATSAMPDEVRHRLRQELQGELDALEPLVDFQPAEVWPNVPQESR